MKQLQREAPRMGAEVARLLRVWGTLMLLGAAEFGTSYLPLGHAVRPVVLILSAVMVLGVVVGFMEVRQGPPIVRAFAVAAAFWLLVLLGLGSVDVLTRVDYVVSGAATK